MRTRRAFALTLLLSGLLAALLLGRQLQRTGGSATPAAPGSAIPSSDPAAPPTGPAAPSQAPSAAPAESASPNPEPVPPYVKAHPDSGRLCGEGMLLVEGIYCPFVAHRCDRWLDEDETRCESYRPGLICEGRPSKLRFCIDRYEYPNMRGVRPAVMVDYFQAEHACRIEDKRLCEAEEWTFACEGLGTWPYPYGLERDAQACNIDRELPEPDLRSFSRPWEVSVEVERLDQREASGSRPGCVSSFGVYDLTGNVDEWVHYGRGKQASAPYETGLKGGYWGPIRARCRPVTTSHNGWFRFYQAGFRCCSDPRDGQPARENLPRKVRLPRRQRMPPPTQPPRPAAAAAAE